MKILLVFALALVWRIAALAHYKMIDSDGAYYGAAARFFAEGNLAKALDPTWPPLFPLIAGLFHRWGFPLEASGIIVSLAASAATVFPCFYLTKAIAGERAGLAAAIIAALHPRLLIFSQSYLAEALYVLLASGSLAIFCHAFFRLRSGGYGRGSAFRIFLINGLLLGLAFLSRPEGFAYFLLLLIVSAGGLLFRRSSSSGGGVKQREGAAALIALVLGFLFVAYPYLYNVHGIEGRWMIGEKAGQSFYSTYKQAYEEEGITVSTSDFASITGSGTKRKPGDYRVAALLRKRPGTVIVHTLENIPKALFVKIPGLMYWPLMLLSVYGILFRRKAARSSCELLFAAWIGVCVLLISPLFLFRRYFAVTIVPLIVWGGIGAEEIRARMSRRAFIAVGAVFVLSLAAYGNHTLARRSKPVLYKEAGLHLKRLAGRFEAPAGGRIPRAGTRETPAMVLTGRKPEPSFYAESQYRPLSVRTIDELPAFFDREGITHLVVDDYVMQASHPGLIRLIEPANAPSWLKEVFSSSRDGHRVVVYRYTPD